MTRIADINAEPTTRRVSPSLECVLFDGKQIGMLREFAGVTIAVQIPPYCHKSETHGALDRDDAIAFLVDIAVNLMPRHFSALPDARQLDAIL